MAGFTATVKARAWKQHTCLICGSVYRYKIERARSAKAGTPAAAQQTAQNSCLQALQTEVDPKPCPHCGLYQPEMIGQSRQRTHGWMLVLTVAAAALIAILCVLHALRYETLMWMALGLGILIFVTHGSVIAANINKNLAANRALAANHVTTGTTQLVSAGTGSVLETVPLSTAGMRPALLMLQVALLLFPSAEIVRKISGWPSNPGWYPPVAGAGDITRIYFPETISSVKGYWNGVVDIHTLNPDEIGLKRGEEFYGQTHDSVWNGTIHAKSSEQAETSSIFVDVKVPKYSALAGKTARLAITVNVLAPQKDSGGIKYFERSYRFTQVTQLKLAPENAGERYLSFWWYGIMGAYLLQFMAGWLLFAKARNLLNGLPAKLVQISD